MEDKRMTSRNQINPNPERVWTVMVHLAGYHNLSEEMIYAIKEVYRVGVTEKFDVIIQFDPSAIGAPARRYVISLQQAARAQGAPGQDQVVGKLVKDGQ